jgi:8-oxo-dGTP diphosphatase
MQDRQPDQPERPVPAVGVVCLSADGRVCLIRRGTPPRLGEWSIPGGKIEWGEPASDAALRELKEETGLAGTLLGLVDVADGIFTSRTHGHTTRHYVLIDYAARADGDPVAGDDAAEARWFTRDQIADLGLWSETVRMIDLALTRFGQPASRDRAVSP